MMLIKDKVFPKKSAQLFRTLGQPARIRILLAIGTGEACVCHLEAALGQRQAYISQQLMALRQAGLVAARRDGRNIYYRLEDPSLLNLILKSAHLLGLAQEEIEYSTPHTQVPECPCPHCSHETENGER